MNSDMSTDGHIQKLYVNIGSGIYKVFNADCELIGTGTVKDLLKEVK